MGGSIVALGNEDVVLLAAVQRFVERNGRAKELLFNLAQTLESGFQFQVVVCISLGNSRDNGDVVALGADIVGG